MPTTKTHGSPSAANGAIGGVPTIHYFDYHSRGRGQVIRLLWEDAGIAYEDIRYSFEEYPEYKKTRIAKMSPFAAVLVVELNGRILTQSYAILRHFARQLDAYEGETEEAKYWADAMCDIVIDLRTMFIADFFSPDREKTYPEHQKLKFPHFLHALETHLKTHELSIKGPYIVGSYITYADLALYQICFDENLTQDGRKGLKDYPRLIQLVDAVESRPNVKAFMERNCTCRRVGV